MTPASTPDRTPPRPGSRRAALTRANRLRWYHWGVVGLSALLTIAVARLVAGQVEARERVRFERIAEHNVDLVVERMGRYEDALWGGVGAIRARTEPMDLTAWRAFSDALELGARYPGINGIGVIHRVAADDLAGHVAAQRVERPWFAVHPGRDADEYLPITFIEPQAPNVEAVGLDVAHEANRLQAARRARDSGLAKVTGPIVLVQDERHTPGFLFYAPFYRDAAGAVTDVDSRRAGFVGLVYAPFIASRLMDGVLDKENRSVGLALRDDGEMLYDEHLPTEPDFDPAPPHRLVIEREVYGRRWSFDARSTLAFRASNVSYQALSILVGGLSLDLLLLGLFLTMSRASRRALEVADELTEELREKSVRLERSNGDLELFASVASHDLREPLRMVGGFTRLLQKRYEGRLDAEADRYIGFAIDGVARMQTLLENLLSYARVDAESGNLDRIDLGEVCADAVAGLRTLLDEHDAWVGIGALPTLRADPSQLLQVFQNLVANAVKFRSPERPCRVEVSAEDRGDEWVVRVADNGIGIEPKYLERVFVMFQQINDGGGTRQGSGIGLAVCRKIVQRHGGTIGIESEWGVGTTVSFTLDKDLPAGTRRPAP